MANVIGTWTGTASGAAVTIPAGARFVSLKNSGATTGTFTGDISIAIGGAVTASSAVSLESDEYFCFPYNELGYGVITVDPVSSTIEITVCF